MNIKWNQSGMPATLVSRLGQRNEFADFKSVLNDAQNQVMTPVDAEAMARELVQSGGREYVEIVRELTTALANARQELEDANRRYERLAESLTRRGISIEVDFVSPANDERVDSEVDSVAKEQDEWEDWNQKFQALLG